MRGKYLLFISIVIFVIMRFSSPATAQTVILRSVDWHPDGVRIALAYDDGTVEIYDRDTKTADFNYNNGTSPAQIVKWSNDGTQLAAGIGSDVHIWNFNTGDHYILSDSPRDVTDLAWNPDDTELVSMNKYGDETSLIIFWDLTGSSPTHRMEDLYSQSYALDWNRFTGQLITTSGLKVQMLDPATGDLFDPPEKVLIDLATSIAWSPNGAKVAISSVRGYGSILDTSSSRIGNFLPTETSFNPIYTTARSSDNRRIATADQSGAIRIWDTVTGQELEAIQLGTDPVYAVDWNPIANEIVYQSTDGALEFHTPQPVVDDLSEQSTAAQTLRDLLIHPECEYACFMGIEPGMTDYQSLLTILDSALFPYTVNPIGSNQQVAAVHIETVGMSPLIKDDTVTIDTSTVGVFAISFAMTNVSVTDVLESYGPPDIVGQSTSYILTYYNLGLTFFVAENEEVITVLLAGENTVNRYNQIGQCQTGVGLCDLPVTSKQITDFTLIDADTDTEIRTIGDNDSITISGRHLVIRAETAPPIVGSVVFNLDGVTIVDNSAPYTVALPDVGIHTLSATPYSAKDGMGIAGTSLEITLTIESNTP